MKQTLLIALLFIVMTTLSWAQVGIGTTKPKADLHVKGNTLVQEEFGLGNLPVVTQDDEDFKLLSRVKNSSPLGKIAILNVDILKVAPVNVINYEFDNISLDNLKDVDLQYDADRYIVGLANFRYVGDAIKKKTVAGKQSVGAFVMRTFISNGTWHLEIRNRFLDLAQNNSLKYYITLIVYDKSYYKRLPDIVTDLNGNNVGTASSIPNLYN